MDRIGVIPAEGAAPRDREPATGAMRRVGGVELALWAIANLRRGGLARDCIVVVTPSEDVAALARRAGVGAASPMAELDLSRALICDPLRCFCGKDTIQSALEGGARELSTHRLRAIERLRVESEADRELADAVARGLDPAHPMLASVRAMRLGLEAAERAIRAIISDVDGVLTDGRTFLASDGAESRAFHMHDGMGVRLARDAGFKIGWLSAAKDTGLVRARAAHLDVDAVDVATGPKGDRFLAMCAELGVEATEAIYIGDDVNDLPCMERAGRSACPRDARPEVRSRADLALDARGGFGAFREVCDLAIAAKGASETGDA